MPEVRTPRFALIAVMLAAAANSSGWLITSRSARGSSAPATPTETLHIAKKTYDFGSKKVGDTIEIEYILENTSDTPFRILGCRVGCTCTIPQELPLTMEPNKKLSFKIRALLPSQPEKVQATFELYTSLRLQRKVELFLKGEVVP